MSDTGERSSSVAPPATGRGAAAGVLVLGMHRSGTSAVTRVLSFLGLATCRPFDLLPAMPGNDRGHWESRSLTSLNEHLLEELGAAWWRPPEAADVRRWAARMSDATRDRLRRAHRDAHPDERPWVWKDPRLCLTLPIWRAALPDPHAAVLVLRQPGAIADSLAARNGMPRADALALWERYLASALAHLDGEPVWLARYDDLLEDPAGWCHAAAGALRRSGLDVGVGERTIDLAASFLSPELRHHVDATCANDDDLTEEQRMLWEWLESAAGHHPHLAAPPFATGPTDG